MADVYKANLVTELYGVPALNVFYWINVNTPSGGTNEESISNMMTAEGWYDAWAAAVGPECKIACLKVQRVADPPVGVPRIFFPTAPGLNPYGECLPSNVAVTLRLHADDGGRRNRGRMRLMGVVEEDSQWGRLTDAAHADRWEPLAAATKGPTNDGGSGNWAGMLYSKADGLYKPLVQCLADPILHKLPQRTTRLCGG